jgi:hypothetical protein
MLALWLACPRIAIADDSGHQQAQQDQQMGMVLGIVGAGTIAIGAAMVAAENYAGFIFIAMGITEVTGAAAASNNNGKTASETENSGGPTGSGSGATGAPADLGFMGLPTGTTLADVCGKAGSFCNCTGTNCSTPQMTLPTLDEAKKGLEQAYISDPAAYKGLPLSEALAELDNNYKNAEKMANNFNDASKNGALASLAGVPSSDVSGASGGTLASVNGTDTNSGDPTGLNKKSGNTKDSSTDASGVTSGTGDTTNGKGLAGIPAPYHKRDAARPVTRRNALTLEDEASGKLLTIFERVSRAIRGEHNRDYTLAKVEWARKDIIRQEKNKEIKEKQGLGNAVASIVAPVK